LHSIHLEWPTCLQATRYRITTNYMHSAHRSGHSDLERRGPKAPTKINCCVGQLQWVSLESPASSPATRGARESIGARAARHERLNGVGGSDYIRVSTKTLHNIKWWTLPGGATRRERHCGCSDKSADKSADKTHIQARTQRGCAEGATLLENAAAHIHRKA